MFIFSDPPFEPQPSVLPVVKLLKIKHCVYIFRDPPFEPQPSVLPVVKLLKIKHCVYIFRDPPFEPQPSMLPVVKFLVESIKKYPLMCCPLCKERVLPQNPSVSCLVIYTVHLCFNAADWTKIYYGNK